MALSRVARRRGRRRRSSSPTALRHGKQSCLVSATVSRSRSSWPQPAGTSSRCRPPASGHWPTAPLPRPPCGPAAPDRAQTDPHRRAPLRLDRLGIGRHRPQRPPAQRHRHRSRHPAHRRQPRRHRHPGAPRPRPGLTRPPQHPPGHRRHHPRHRLTTGSPATTAPARCHMAPPTRQRGLHLHLPCPGSASLHTSWLNLK